MRTPAPAEPAALPRGRLRQVTVVLCTTEVVSWGVLFYAFPVLLPLMTEDTGWSSTAVVGAFTLAQLVAAGAGLVVGRLLHRRGPHLVMTAGSVTAVVALLLVAAAPTLATFTTAWLLAGAAMAATLYPPAFAALTTWAGPRRVGALTALTLVAGLASTVFAPLTAVLGAQLGWRGAYAVLAAVLVVTVPLHAWGLRAPWPAPERPTPSRPPAALRRRTPRGPDRELVRLVLSLTLTGVCLWSTLFLLVPHLVDRGLSLQEAAWVLGVGGIGQVCGRLGYGWWARRSHVEARTRAVFAGVALTTAALAAVPGVLMLALAASLVAGAARGLHTLVQATAVADRWGTADYARLNAVASAPLTVAAAVAPWLGTALAAALASTGLALLALAAVAALGTAAVPRSPAPRAAA